MRSTGISEKVKPVVSLVKGYIDIFVPDRKRHEALWRRIRNPCLFILFIVPHLTTAQIVSGTSVVVACGDSEIVVGADSRLTSPYDSTVSMLGCKIIVVDDSIIFVHSGILLDSTFDMHDEIVKAMTSTKHFELRLLDFQFRVQRDLRNVIIRRKRLRPADFTRFHWGKEADCIVIVDTKDSLIIRRISFDVAISPYLPDGFSVGNTVLYPFDSLARATNVPLLLSLGRGEMTSVFNGYLSKRQLRVAASDFPRIVYSLISLDIVCHPHDIGDPIDILRIRHGKKAEWIRQDKPPCR